MFLLSEAGAGALGSLCMGMPAVICKITPPPPDSWERGGGGSDVPFNVNKISGLVPRSDTTAAGDWMPA